MSCTSRSRVPGYGASVRTEPLRRFKDETRDLHELAETHVRILDANATVNDYRLYLRAMYGFHAPIEEMFVGDSDLAEHGFGAPLRRKAPLLLGDLRALGDHVPPIWCTVLPDSSSLARRLGIAYVLEGSTLGGRFILAHMPAQLAGVPTAFLQGYGPSTGASWKAYAAIAERLLATRVLLDDAIAGARDTFECLIEWLARHASWKAAS